MEYTVVQNTSLTPFVAEVNRLAKQGWTPLGGLVIVTLNYETPVGQQLPTPYFYQAMTKIEAST